MGCSPSRRHEGGGSVLGSFHSTIEFYADTGAEL